MTENEEEYSEYVMDLSRIRVTMLSLLSGFTFTVIVLFLTQLPNPSSFMSQLTLLFLAVLFGLTEFLLAWQCIIVIGLYKVRTAPPRAKTELTAFNLLMQAVFSLWGYQ